MENKEIEHNAQTCNKDINTSSEFNKSIQDIGSLLNSNEIEDT